MRVVQTSLLDAFSTKHPTARTWISCWLKECKVAEWRTPADIKQRHPTASILKGNLVIFNVKGNDYRLVTQVAYKTQIIFIKWIGTHQDYNGINWEKTSNETGSN